MWHKHKVGVVFITKNNGSTIRDAIEDVFCTGFVEDVLVVDLESRDSTLSEISYTKARVLTAGNYQDAFYLAMDRLMSSIIIFADPTNSIPGTQVRNFLPYSNDYHMVFSSRVNWLGANIDSRDVSFVKNHKKYGKMLSDKFLSSNIDDINSNMFLINKEAFNQRDFDYKMTDTEFVFETLVNSLCNHLRVIQIPVEYHSLLKNYDGSLLLGMKSHFGIMKRINRSKKKIEKNAVLSMEKHDVKMHAINKQLEPVSREAMDPYWVRQRIRDLKKRLGDVGENVYVTRDVRKELEQAVLSVVSDEEKANVKQEGKNVVVPVPKKEQVSIEDRYEMLKKIDAGLKYSKKKASKKGKNN